MHTIKVSDDAHKALQDYAAERGVTLDKAADDMIAVAEGRLLALKGYAAKQAAKRAAKPTKKASTKKAAK